MSRAEGLSIPTCMTVLAWPAAAVLRINPPRTVNGDISVMLQPGEYAFFIGVGRSLTDALWDLDRAWRDGVRGARFSKDVLGAIAGAGFSRVDHAIQRAKEKRVAEDEERQNAILQNEAIVALDRRGF